MLSIIALRNKIGIGYRYAASVLMENLLKLIKLSFFVMYNKTIYDTYTKYYIIVSAVKQLTAINRMQSKSCLHNICMCAVYI